MKKDKMSSLGIGQSARIDNLFCDTTLKARLTDLGLIPGTLIECLHISPNGSPIAFSIRGAVIALRKTDCESILIEI